MARTERREWRQRARETAPVFIVGEPRSGTSILFRSLQSHPAFLPARGTHLAESQAPDLLLDLLGPDHPPESSPLVEYAQGMDAVAGIVDDIQGLARRRRLVRALAGRSSLARKPVWLAAGEHHVVRRYFLKAHERRGARRLLDKSPLQLPWVPHLGTAFPQARFLYIVRHPVDVYSSYKRRFSVDPASSGWADVDEAVFCDGWSARTQYAARLARRDPRMLIVRYEDFTGDTEPVVRRVLDHVGEPFDAVCLLADDGEFGQFAVDPHLFARVVTTTKEWRDYVDTDGARRIEHRLAGEMARLDYEPHVA